MSNQKFRAIIIDDSPTDQQTLSHLLTKRLNCQIETANDGLEGIDKLSRQRFSVVFLDMLMPPRTDIKIFKIARRLLPPNHWSADADGATSRTSMAWSSRCGASAMN
jgi:CheY-like chemotaxis protein